MMIKPYGLWKASKSCFQENGPHHLMGVGGLL